MFPLLMKSRGFHVLLLLSNYRPYRHLHKVWGASRNMGKGGGQNSYFLRIIEVKKPSCFFFGGGGGETQVFYSKRYSFQGVLTIIALTISLLLFLRALMALLRLTLACDMTSSISLLSTPVSSTCKQ